MFIAENQSQLGLLNMNVHNTFKEMHLTVENAALIIDWDYESIFLEHTSVGEV